MLEADSNAFSCCVSCAYETHVKCQGRRANGNLVPHPDSCFRNFSCLAFLFQVVGPLLCCVLFCVPPCRLPSLLCPGAVSSSGDAPLRQISLMIALRPSFPFRFFSGHHRLARRPDDHSQRLHLRPHDLGAALPQPAVEGEATKWSGSKKVPWPCVVAVSFVELLGVFPPPAVFRLCFCGVLARGERSGKSCE